MPKEKPDKTSQKALWGEMGNTRSYNSVIEKDLITYSPGTSL